MCIRDSPLPPQPTSDNLILSLKIFFLGLNVNPGRMNDEDNRDEDLIKFLRFII